MKLINHAIANLFNGVSQQAPSIRQQSQCEEQVNGYSSIVEGMHKRHPTTLVSRLTDTVDSKAFCHVINRDEVEKYVVVVRNKSLEVWDIDGNKKTVRFPAGTSYLDVENPAEDLTMVTVADYTIVVNKTKKVARENNSALTGSIATYAKYSDLPATGVVGTIYKISGTPDNAWTVYFCKWNGSSYEECTKDESGNRLTYSTMPHRLTREADGSFTFAVIEWPDRLVGDDTTAEPPSFVGETISDVFFFRNRLGFLSGENVIMSRSGQYFHMWPETVTQILDSDPIDLAVSHIKVSNLKHAIPFNKNLLLFSEQTQFVMASNDLLTPKSAAIHQTTEFECSPRAKPVAAGSNVYFAVEKSGFSAIREYYIMPYQSTYEADDVTAHIPKYIPGGITRLVESTNEDIILALSDRTPNSLYCYKYYWKGDEKVQSAWSRWEFASDCKILNMDIMGTRLYLVVQKPDAVYLEMLDLQVGLIEDNLPILVYLDRKVYGYGSYNIETGKTRWYLPYHEDNVKVVLSGEFVGKEGAPLTVTRPASNIVEAHGDYSQGCVYIGVPYEMRYRFTAQYIKDQQQTAMARAVVKMRNFSVFYTNTGYFRAEVTPVARETQTYIFNAKKLGMESLVVGKNNIETGVFKFPVMSEASTTVIELVNDSYLPSFFQSAEYEALFTMRSARK